MKAAVLHAPGDLRMEQVPVPSVKADYVLMKVKAAGICGSDIDRVMKTGTYHFPTIPGHEFCGEIARTGTGVLNWKPGDRAVAAPIMPCYSCSSCQEGNYGQCDNYNYLGSRTDGGFAEYVAVPESNLIRLPDSISYLKGPRSNRPQSLFTGLCVFAFVLVIRLLFWGVGLLVSLLYRWRKSWGLPM